MTSTDANARASGNYVQFDSVKPAADGSFALSTTWVSANVGNTHQPAINGIFDTPHMTCAPGCTSATCSCTFPDRYWTSTTYRPTTARAWDVDFGFGQMRDSLKASGMLRVRAVRSAS